MGCGDQLARQRRIIQTLISSKHGKTVADLVKEENCHPRTIYRDLEALQEAGFPIYQERRDGVKTYTGLSRKAGAYPRTTDCEHLPLPVMGLPYCSRCHWRQRTTGH
jgi:Fe2+ or Zn2+ uptake regulation protein